MFYSETTGGFYSTEIHGNNIPADAVEITLEQYQSLLDGQSGGKLIQADANGYPILVDPPPIVPDPKFVGIEFDGVMCSATRDDQNGLMAVLLASQLQGQSFQPTQFYFANGNTLVITKENIQAFIATWMPFRQSFFVPE